MWTNFYQSGGWGMYPTTFFGFLLVLSGVLLMLRPEKRFLPLVSSLGILTVASGLLGTATGMIHTFLYASEKAAEEQVRIAILGCAESLNNLVLALLLVVFAGLLSTVGAIRALKNKQPAGAVVA